MKKNKTIIVSRAAGFIGSALIRYIVNNTNFNIINIDKLTYSGNLESLDDVKDNKNYIFEEEDICNLTELKRIFIKYKLDIVMHLATESHVDRSIDSPIDFIQTKIFGTYTLLENTRVYFQSLEGEK